MGSMHFIPTISRLLAQEGGTGLHQLPLCLAQSQARGGTSHSHALGRKEWLASSRCLLSTADSLVCCGHACLDAGSARTHASGTSCLTKTAQPGLQHDTAYSTGLRLCCVQCIHTHRAGGGPCISPVSRGVHRGGGLHQAHQRNRGCCRHGQDHPPSRQVLNNSRWMMHAASALQVTTRQPLSSMI